jgi:hypothetical protein
VTKKFYYKTKLSLYCKKILLYQTLEQIFSIINFNLKKSLTLLYKTYDNLLTRNTFSYDHLDVLLKEILSFWSLKLYQ